MHARIPTIILAVGCLVAFVGCTSYRREFRSAVREAGGQYEGVYGPWEGEWRSAPSGHHGPLWCLIGRAGEGADEQLEFRYRAGWGKVLRGNFTQRTAVDPVPGRPGAFVVQGSKDLGVLGGLYTIEGTVDPDRFDARFTSTKGDRGTMGLRRPDGRR
ncbi:hypothetical protein BH23VER1_BH23VER1_19340 [soil metagenome]